MVSTRSVTTGPTPTNTLRGLSADMRIVDETHVTTRDMINEIQESLSIPQYHVGVRRSTTDTVSYSVVDHWTRSDPRAIDYGNRSEQYQRWGHDYYKPPSYGKEYQLRQIEKLYYEGNITRESRDYLFKSIFGNPWGSGPKPSNMSDATRVQWRVEDVRP